MVTLIIASFSHRALYKLTYESRKALGVYEYYIAIDNDPTPLVLGGGLQQASEQLFALFGGGPSLLL